MSLLQQIAWGTVFLIFCFATEILLLVWCTVQIKKHENLQGKRGVLFEFGAPITFALVVTVLAHTIQVWIWALAWLYAGVLEDLNSSIYFSLVTHTTLGYGDIVLGPELRIFASFAAVAGLLAFGLSTAYLVAVMTRLFQQFTR